MKKGCLSFTHVSLCLKEHSPKAERGNILATRHKFGTKKSLREVCLDGGENLGQSGASDCRLLMHRKHNLLVFCSSNFCPEYRASLNITGQLNQEMPSSSPK